MACSATPPRTLYWDADHLAELKQAPSVSSKVIRNSLRQLEAAATTALQRGPYSVVDKAITPPSGDKHDYMSYSRYWWPNPDTPDGLPYVRRDGVVNRELLSQGDRVRIGAFFEDIELLVLAAYLIDEQKYAPHAMHLLRTWFIDPKTRMNPNLNFGQAVPGRAEGRGVGIIDTRDFIRVLDALALLDAVDAMPESDHQALQAWFATYLDWLVTSTLGAEERAQENNHGSWYAAQAARIALFVNRPEMARKFISDVKSQRIPSCIKPDGSQPQELGRTRSLHYSLFNLSALFTVARLGEQTNIDLWHDETGGPSRLKQGLDFLVPSIRQPSRWPHPELGDFTMSDRTIQLLLLGRLRWQEDEYDDLLLDTVNRDRDSYLSPLQFSGYAGEGIGSDSGS